MKRRKFAITAGLLAALLTIAISAASVNAATSSPKAAATHGNGKKVGPGTWSKAHGNAQGVSGKIGTATFKPVVPQKFGYGAIPPKNQSRLQSTDRAIPGRGNPSHGAPTQAPSGGTSALLPPHVHSLPITTRHAAASQAYGLNEYDQETIGGYGLTPPDQALAEGNGFVFEAVNNLFAIMDTNFGHITNVEPMEQFWAPAILATGYCNVSDPRAIYDNVTRKWYVTEVAYGPPGCAPGSAVFIAVSTTSDPLSIYNIYVLDTSFDGTTCTADGCLADQPLIGMNRNALFISTNSFDWDTGAFNGTQIYVIDSTALAAGLLFPNLVHGDVGNCGGGPEDLCFTTPEGFDTCGVPIATLNVGYCWYSMEPGVTPNQSFATDRGGTEFMMSALDWLGSVDNRVALWALTNTSSISGFPSIFINYAIAGTETYGWPATDVCMVMPQMTFFGLSPTQCGFAEQPHAGNTPLCDTFFAPFGLICEPGAIQNNDDRMLQVATVKAGFHAAHNWAGLNTDALVADPLGVLHRRSAIAYFDISATCWGGPYIFCAGVNAQGYVANWNNDVVYPSIGVATDGVSAAMVYTLTGNTNFPSIAVSNVSDSAAPTSIPVVLAGKDVLDDICNDFPFCGFGAFPYRPRYGDYSAAIGDGRTIYLAGEYVQAPSCSDAQFIFDPSCTGFSTRIGARGFYSNWGTGLVKVNV